MYLDMWSRTEDNVLVQTISTTKIQLNSYNPDWDVFRNLVEEEIPDCLILVSTTVSIQGGGGSTGMVTVKIM
jgi:hypothetical protein